MTAEGLRWRITKAVRASDLPAPSRLIMFVLADVADIGTAEIPARFTPSVAVLARETGLSRRAVQDHLNALEATAWIVRSRPSPQEQWAGERVRYRLCLPPGVVQEMHHPVQEVHDPGAGGAPGVVQGMHEGGEGGAPRDRSCSDQGQISQKTSSSESAHVRAPTGEPDSPLTDRPPKRRRGTRIPDDFAVTDEMRAWAKEHVPQLARAGETEKFVDHFRAAPGRYGVKLDWVATWRNWMRRAAEQLAVAQARASPRNGTELREHNGLMLKQTTIDDLDRRKRFEAMDAAEAAARPSAIEGSPR